MAQDDDWLDDEDDEELIEYVESIREKKQVSDTLRELLKRPPD